MREKKTDYVVETLKQKLTAKNLPSSLTFELTPLCNFNCPMCYIHQTPEQAEENGGVKEIAYWLELAEEAQKAGVLFICMTGGEIFTYPDFRLLYEKIYDMGINITLLTNLSLADEEATEWLSKRKPWYIKTTLYGASDEMYEKFCGVKKGHTTVTSNILRLKDAGVPVFVGMTATEENFSDLEKIEEWTKEHELPFFCYTGIRNAMRGAERQSTENRIEHNNLPDECDLEHECDLFDFVPGKPFSCCKVYRNSAIISWQGKMIGCNYVDTVQVDVEPGKLIENYRNLWNKLDALKTPEECFGCKYAGFCNPCPGALEGESGDPEKISPYVCNVAKNRYIHMNLKGTKPATEE